MKNTKNRVIKFARIFKPFILLLILALIIFNFRCCTSAGTIQEYENQIKINIEQIQHYDDIKEQLHTTAQLLRQEKPIDSELISNLSAKWHDCDKKIQQTVKENNKLELKIKELNKPVLLGYFTITHYDICYNCTGKHPDDKDYGITATGTVATPNRTVAVDPKVVPLGSEVVVEGHTNTYIAEDTGGAIKGNRIDICVSSDAEAFQKGRLYNVPVYIIKKIKE